MVKAVLAASLPPARNLLLIPLLIQATPFSTACSEVEQAMEWLISGPLLCRSCPTQDERLPKVVVGELSVLTCWQPLSRNSP